MMLDVRWARPGGPEFGFYECALRWRFIGNYKLWWVYWQERLVKRGDLIRTR